MTVREATGRQRKAAPSSVDLGGWGRIRPSNAGARRRLRDGDDRRAPFRSGGAARVAGESGIQTPRAPQAAQEAAACNKGFPVLHKMPTRLSSYSMQSRPQGDVPVVLGPAIHRQGASSLPLFFHPSDSDSAETQLAVEHRGVSEAWWLRATILAGVNEGCAVVLGRIGRGRIALSRSDPALCQLRHSRSATFRVPRLDGAPACHTPSK